MRKNVLGEIQRRKGIHMTAFYKHPLQQMADRLKQAFVLHGFKLKDNGESRELVRTDALFPMFEAGDSCGLKPMMTEDSRYALRTSLLPGMLAGCERQLPLRAVTCGFAYDAGSGQYPQHLLLEGIIACPDLNRTDLKTQLKAVMQEVFGINADLHMTPAGKGQQKLIISAAGKEIDAGILGMAGWMPKALIGKADTDMPVWIIRCDIDTITMQMFDIADRKSLYSTLKDTLSACECNSPSYGEDFSSRTRSILRKRGYLEFVGERFYTADAYRRMNMIQEAWDTNNVALRLAQPIEDYDNPLTDLRQREGLPTVLAPSLEQAMSENFAAGVKEIKLFEIGHIFKPARAGGRPWEKVSLSIGAYGPDLTMREFRTQIDEILTQLGISNHFFIPTDMAIAYKTDECCVILDEKMKYLDGNCGHISPVALKNFRIDTEAFMAQFELDTIENKSDEEYGFVPYELR